MRRFRNAVLGAALLAVVLLAAACGPGEDDAVENERGAITVGAVAFAENEILGEMYAQVLEGAGYDVTRQLTIDSREILQPALQGGEIDVAPEYLATLIAFLDPEATPSTDPDEAYAQLEPLAEEHGLVLLDRSDVNNTNAFVVTQETAGEHGLATVSDLRPLAGDMTLGGPPECPEREFCIPGLRDVYGIEFGEFTPLDVGGPLTVAALDGGEIDVGLLFATSGVIQARDFVMLEDDQSLQAADYITPAVNADAHSDELETLLNEISALLTTESMTALNARVEVDQDEPADVARDFLEESGLL
jgi:osmoprotectant transport system substrate-binding protein